MNVPQNIELEQQIIGTILVYPEQAYTIANEIISPQMFWHESHGVIYRVVGELYKRGIMPGISAVLDELKSRDLMIKAGGAQVLFDCQQWAQAPQAIEGCARKLADKALYREVMRQCHEIIAECQAQELTPDAVLHSWRQRIEHVAKFMATGDELQTLEQLAIEVADRVTQQWADGRAVCTTGIDWLDRLTDGWQPGDLWIWAARTNTGKSRVLLYSLLRTAHAGNKVGFISLEMNKYRLMKYAGSSALAIAGSDRDAVNVLRPIFIDGKREVGGELKRINYGGRVLMAAELRSNSIRNIEGLVRTMARAGCVVIGIDQLEHFAEYSATERESITDLVRMIAATAARYGVAIALAHQISREGTDFPRLNNLAESDAVGRMADFVLLMHDPARRSQDDDHPELPNPRKLVLFLAKSRGGSTKIAPTAFDFELGVIPPTDLIKGVKL